MTFLDRPCRSLMPVAVLALALVASAAPASAQISCYPNAVLPFPRIDLCAFPGHYQDSSLVQPFRCVGTFKGPLPDSIRPDDRSLSLRFKRNRVAEARPDFGGYRIYRVTNQPDTARMVLIRRFSRNEEKDDLIDRTWNFSVVDSNRLSPTYLQFMGRAGSTCAGQVVHDSVVTFVDPDSNGSYQKRCRRYDSNGNCTPLGDSVMVLVAPPGPHDGFRTWYAITYEAFNERENTYEDLFVPDTSNWSACERPGDPNSCPNQNRKETNLTQAYVEPTGGPTTNLERVGVVPNPFRARSPWDPSGSNELHFVNLPQVATIQIYTLAGDLVNTLQHNDPVRDFERWNLRNQDGKEVASGIYMYRVVSSTFSYQNRFIVIR